MKGQRFIGWLEFRREDAPSSPGQWERCGKLFNAEDGSSALIGLWLLPCPQINARTGRLEIKLVCSPHEGKEQGGSIPMVNGDVMLQTEKWKEDGRTMYRSRKIGIVVSREHSRTHRQYYAVYFFGTPLVRRTDSGMVWLHVHLWDRDNPTTKQGDRP
jgi:hypothetical protein